MSDSQQSQNPYVPGPPAAAPSHAKTTNGLGIAALIIGILALVGAFVPILNYGTGFVAFIGLVLGVIALFLKNKAKGVAIAGAAVSVVALILSIIMAIVYTAGFASAVNDSIKQADASRDAAAAVPIEVSYEVTSDQPTVDVMYSSYTNGTSGSESSTDQPAPFTKDFTVETGGTFDFRSFFLSANTGMDGGTVTCTITVGGEVVSTQTATGQFASVSCSSSDFNGLDDQS